MENRPVPLTDTWLRANGLFVAEGRMVVSRLLMSSRWRLKELLLTPVAEAAMTETLAGVEPSRRPAIQIVDQAQLDEIGGFNFHQGCLGLAERAVVPPWTALDLVSPPAGPVVVLESVRDPDNVGSIFRAALAFGARAVLIGPGCADPFYRKTVRTSMAAVLALPFGSAEPWPGMLDDLRALGYTVVATTPDESAEPLPDAANTLRRARVALLVGSEGEGLTAGAVRAANRRVRIPIAPGVDSLNVATATAVALYALSSGAGCVRSAGL